MRAICAIFCLPVLLCAQEFQFRQEYDTIPVEIDGWHPFAPWTGGSYESTPKLVDIDADGDLDFFMGNFMGYVDFYQNNGNIYAPIFNLITPLFAQVNLNGFTFYGRTSPVFCDLDADGDLDLFTGDGLGLVHYWQNVGNAQNPEFQWVTDSLGYIDVNGYNKMDFWDVDLDGDYDLFMGDWTGRIIFYRNEGTAQQYNFSLVSNYWLGIDVGYNACPALTDIDADGDLDLFIGNEQGRIWFYRNDGDSLNFNFTLVSNYYDSIDVDWYAAPEFADIDGDGDYDLFVGRSHETPNSISPGDVFYYQNIGSPQLPQWQLITRNYCSLDEGQWAQNTTTDIDGDGDADLFTKKAGDFITFYQNVGNLDSPSFVHITDTYQNISVNGNGGIRFADMDADADPDLFLGEVVIPNPPYPGLHFFANEGTPQNAAFSLYTNNLVPGSYNVGICPALADIDADGDYDLFLSTENPYLYFENIGTPQRFNFANPVAWQGITNPFAVPSCFYDLDGDGDLDLFMPDNNYNLVRFYRNIGTPQMPIMERDTLTFSCGGISVWFDGIDIRDIDNDGDGDFFLSSSEGGGIMFYRNITGEASAPPPVERHPRAGLQISLGPNPANPITVVSCQFLVPSNISLQVFDISGRMITELASGFHLPGEYRYVWDASNHAAGMYFIRLRAGEEKLVEKVVILK